MGDGEQLGRETIWQARVTGVGRDIAEFIEAGVLILFGEPVPDALAEVSVVHTGGTGESELRSGDLLKIGDTCLGIEDFGEMANSNFRDLGHIVLYCDVGDNQLLPGAVKVSGRLSLPDVGDLISLIRREADAWTGE